MYEVIGLKDFGTWLKKDEICLCNDTCAIDLLKRGFLEIKKYHISNHKIKWNTRQSIEILRNQARALSLKAKAYEDLVHKCQLNGTKEE